MGLDDDAAKARETHSCLARFDEFAECMTPARQFRQYYREATYEDCPICLFKFTHCLKSKLPAAQKRVHEAAATTPPAGRRRAPDAHVGHVWDFKPEYKHESLRRYAR